MNTKYPYNKNFFKKINTKDKAYWLGFIYADGCNQPKYNRAVVLLSIKDIEHLKKFCKSLKRDISSIYVSPPNEKAILKGRQINAQASCRLSLNSKDLSKNLLDLGVFHRKTEILDFPEKSWIPEKLMSHFIRGFFDGDGCITKTTHKNVTRYRILIASSPLFCKKFAEYIHKKLNINVGIWACKNCKIRIASISGNRQVKIFCDWMYNKSITYLERKYLKYNQLLNKIRKINNKCKKTYSIHNNITFDKNRNRWIASARLNKKTIKLGRFSTEMDAFKAQQEFFRKTISPIQGHLLDGLHQPTTSPSTENVTERIPDSGTPSLSS
jgi:ribosomal protein L37AE/L43A